MGLGSGVPIPSVIFLWLRGGSRTVVPSGLRFVQAAAPGVGEPIACRHDSAELVVSQHTRQFLRGMRSECKEKTPFAAKLQKERNINQHLF